MCGSGDGGISECFTLSGWMKIVESFCIFSAVTKADEENKLAAKDEQLMVGAQIQL